MYRALCLLIALMTSASGCLVDARCATNEDCPAPKVCDPTGACVHECVEDADCGPGFRCDERRCVVDGDQVVTCPEEMVAVAGAFCVDRWEASRPDATADHEGEDGGRATSRPGVLPWRLDDDNATAAAACEAAGKRLCSPFEWQTACHGEAFSVYGYGDTYEPTTCNGIDTFDPASPHLAPTQSFPGCTNGAGIYDMNGNLWEHVAGGDGTLVRGGAFNCIDSMTLHRCDYVPGSWVPSALGFRCCLSPTPVGPDGPPEVIDDVAPLETLDADGEGGCLDPDLGETDGGDATPECATSADCEALHEPAPGCRRWICVQPQGRCEQQALENGGACEDGDPCTLGDQCLDGACQAGSGAPVCDDGNPCTDDTCVAGQGCAHAPNDAACDDGSDCTEGDRCADGLCVGAPICDCEEDADCDDGDPCNGVMVCDKAVTPYQCALVPDSVVICPQPTDPCRSAACNPASGLCEEEPKLDGAPCEDGNPCTQGDQCVEGACAPGAENVCGCPEDMVPVADAFCMDRYEASRPDAEATSYGVDESKATSRYGVLPWFPIEHAPALAACEAAGKRLCTEAEVYTVCAGPEDEVYVYGDAYSADTCNGIDSFCDCSHANCAALEICPYPHCRAFGADGTYAMGCGAAFHVVPTGSFPDCLSPYGAYDINGNVWEMVDTGTEESWYKGGAYNCGDSETLHRCDGLYQNISAKGFRCCKDQAGEVDP